MVYVLTQAHTHIYVNTAVLSDEACTTYASMFPTCCVPSHWVSLMSQLPPQGLSPLPCSDLGPVSKLSANPSGNFLPTTPALGGAGLSSPVICSLQQCLEISRQASVRGLRNQTEAKMSRGTLVPSIPPPRWGPPRCSWDVLEHNPRPQLPMLS